MKRIRSLEKVSYLKLNRVAKGMAFSLRGTKFEIKDGYDYATNFL